MRYLIIAATVFMVACTTSTAGDTKGKASLHTSSSKKVLLELFTSQGCSSCPPADNLVSRLASADTNLIIVSYHVDYWDRLGWKDIFSNHDYTLRQQQYVQALHAESPYTPQAVVQGQFEMVGSNQPGILNAVKVANAQSDDVTITAQTSVNNHTVTLTYQLSKAVDTHNQITAVLVQNQSSTPVARGENSGRQLAGYHVARTMKTIPVTKKEDTLQLSLPDDVKTSNASVVVFLQDGSSKKIMAVQQVAL